MGMANTIKKGESLFIPFKNGESIYDSQLKPRMYKTKEQYDRFSYRFKDAEMVEYVEVVRCEKCRYRSQYADENGFYKCGGIQTEDGDLVLMVKPDGFCNQGERKDNGTV